jgi:glycine hydroxymethyltransferase
MAQLSFDEHLDLSGNAPGRLARQIFSLIEQHGRWRQKECINLIASHNIMSPTVRNVLASVLSDKKSAGFIGQRSHAGGAYLDKIETLAGQIIATIYGARYVEYRPLSCAIANLVAIFAMTEHGDRVLAMPRRFGGDPSTRENGPPKFRGLALRDVPFDEETWNIDLARLEREASEFRPKLLIIGSSMPLFPYPLREIRAIADSVGARILYDGAHLLGLIACGEFQDPLGEGADAVTTSTQKTIPGPVGGLLLCNDGGLYKNIRNVSDHVLQSYHNAVVAAVALALLELRGPGRRLGSRIVANAQALGKALDDEGFDVIGRRHGYTRSHEVLLRFPTPDARDDAFRRLEASNLMVTRMGAPQPAILRLGTSEVTRYGMGPAEMVGIARLLRRAVIERENSDAVKEGAAALAREHPVVQYGLAEAVV